MTNKRSFTLIESLNYAKNTSEKTPIKADKKKALVLSIETGLDEAKRISKAELNGISLKELLSEI